MDLQKEEIRGKQLEINKKQKNRSKNTDLCQEMIQLIIDIADVIWLF